MKKNAKIALIAIISCVVVAGGFIVIRVLTNSNDDHGNGINIFDNEDRYDDSILNNMGVIYDSQSDLHDWRGGWSNTDQCPWGFVHTGIDFFFKNDSTVLAAAPGKVIDISYVDNGVEYENRYFVVAVIQFNQSVILGYCFEPETNQSSDWDNQKSMLSVEVGDWVEQGQEIGRFLAVGSGGHVHFDVSEGSNMYCPQKYLSTTAYDDIMSVIEYFHPGENLQLCYYV